MIVEIWSDVVCPWCYIGKRQFDVALERLRHGPDPLPIDVEVVYRAYQLDPRAPTDSAVPVVDVYARKFGGPERAKEIMSHLTRVASEAGLDFDFDRAVRANTLLAHRILWITLERFGSAAQSAVKEAFLRAYFTEGKNVGDAAILVDLAAFAIHSTINAPSAEGTDTVRESLVAAIDSGAGVGEVNEQIATAASHGITAVPTYVIDGRFAVPGAQDPDTFERVLRRAAERV